jgi:serine/threonine protein kinase
VYCGRMPTSGARLTRVQAAIDARYTIDHEVGAGGMATVYAAHDKRHGRRVAIKVLREELSGALGTERFPREIEISARLQHPHIIGLLDSGSADGLLYYVMPFVDGMSLRSRLAREGGLSIDDGIRVLQQLLDALAYAHREGVIHRDIKPENIMLAGYSPRVGSRWHVMVADFGVAKALEVSGPAMNGLTQTGFAIGTPAYMSPEQASADPRVDHRCDIYAAGVVAYEMFAGRPPFYGSTPQQVMASHLTKAPEPITNHRQNIPPELDRVVLRALEKHPADRWPTADEMLARIEAIASRASTNVVTPVGQPVERTFKLTGRVCRKLNRNGFDPNVIGADMSYVDNQVESDVVVVMLHSTGQDASFFREHLRTLPYRCLAPTLVGFEAISQNRPALSLENHIALVREFLGALVERLEPRITVLAGFSSGADIVMRVVAEADASLPPVDGVLALGGNLSLETCFVTRIFMRLGAHDDAAIIESLRQFTGAAASLEDWLNIHEYVVDTLRKFGHDVEPVRRFSDDTVHYFEHDDAFPVLFRTLATKVRAIRCVCEDVEICRRLISEMRLKNLDDPTFLGDSAENALIVERGLHHFDLAAPAVMRRYLDGIVQDGLVRRDA